MVDKCLDTPARLRQIDANVANSAGNTLLHLCVQVSKEQQIESRPNVKVCL